MKVLLDECVDVEFRKSITGHDVFTVAYMRWKGLKNGDLLAHAVQHGFEVLVTTDRGVPYQQHVVALQIAVVIIHSPTNDFADLQAMVPALLTTLNHIAPGTVTNIFP